MTFLTWLQYLRAIRKGRVYQARGKAPRPAGQKLCLRRFEDRTLPSLMLTAADVAVSAANGAVVSNTITVSDSDTGAAITLSATAGNTPVNTGSGTWTWSETTPSGPAQTGAVTIYATDSDGQTAACEFWLNVGQVFVVNTAADTPAADLASGRDSSGNISLRSAIQAVNYVKASSPALIAFQIPGTGPFTITPQATLDPIQAPVIIDGYTQAGSYPNTLPGQGTGAGDNAVRLITLDGTQLAGSFDLGSFATYDEASAALDAVSESDGLVIATGNSTVTGLMIQNFGGMYFAFFPGGYYAHRFLGADIRLTSGGNTVAGNYLTNSATGVFVDNVPNNVIGGTSPAARNVIDGSSALTIQGVGATGNRVQGSYIGLDGTHFLNSGDGIDILNASHNTIGGAAPGAGNVIVSSNTGIWIEGDSDSTPASGNVVQGNYIGTNPAGDACLLPAGVRGGVTLLGYANDTTIGGVDTNTPGASLAGGGNLVSGWRTQVNLDWTGPFDFQTGNVVEGNYIGTNANGTASLASPGTQRWGVWAGYDSVISGNIISGCDYGIIIQQPGSQVYGNRIGTDATGTLAIPNGTGVTVGGIGDRIGGTAPGEGNIIAFNDGPGVSVWGTGDQIEGNSIYENTGAGVEAQGSGNQIEANSIYANAGPGVWVQSDPFGSADPFGSFSDGLATGNSIQGNSIYGNGGLGISLGSMAVDVNGNPLTLQQVQDSLQSNPGLWDHDEPSTTVILNDSLAHVGSDSYQNFPVLSSASSSSTDTPISGTFSQTAEPNTTITLDFYANPAVDPSGYGQGQTWLGSTTITTDANGNVAFSADLSTGTLGNLAGQWITATATDPGGNTSEFALDVQATTAPSQSYAQYLQSALPQSSATANSMTIQASASVTPATVIAAVNGLTNVTQPVTVILDLGGGTYSSGGIAANPPPNVTFVVQNGTLDPVYPALTVAGGQVSILNCTLTTSGNAPTLLITGGNVTLRNDTIQESTGFNDPAISITGGTLDLGTTASPGGNTINVHSGGAVIQNSTATPISAVGDSFTVNGAPLTPSSSLSGVVWEDFNNDGQVDFGEMGISGVTITLSGTDFLGNAVSESQQTDSNGAYVFLNLLPGNYTLTETPPSGYLPGIDVVGTGGGSVVASGQISVPLGAEFNGLNYNFGEQPLPGGSIQKGQTAGIGFWNNKNGQALIRALNGGAGSQLADWLAATLPNIFGANAGSNDLAGLSNAAVATLFQQDFLLKGVKLDAQLLATALNVYVTNATLDPTKVASSYGFTVSGDGVGTATVNVGSSGAAFGVANNSVLTVMDLLLDADAQAVNGILYNGNAIERSEANTVFSAVNQAGGVG